MAKPNFHDRSWHDIDWDTWGSQFSIVDRASSVGELQNGITTRYMEVQDLLSQLPPHAGRAHSLVALWRQEVNGYGRTVVFAESARLLRRLDELYSQVTAQLHAARQAAKAARKARQRAQLASGVRAGAVSSPTPRSADHDKDDFEGMRHSAATSRQRSDDVNPGLQTAAMRWAAVQAAMARECDGAIADTAKPVTARQFRNAVDAPGDGTVEQLQPARDNGMVRIVVVAGRTQFWTTGLPNLEQLGIARFSIYRRDGNTRRFQYVAGIRRPEDMAAQREAVERGSG